VLAEDAVDLFVYSELKVDLGLGLAGVNEVVITLGAGLSPECPGDSVNEGGFAVAVVATDAGDVDAAEVEGRDVIPVAHEVVE